MARGGFKLGSLFVTLTAKTDAFTRDMGKALERLDKFSKKVAEAGGKLGAAGAAITALSGVAIKVASDYDSRVAGALERQEKAWAAVASEIGVALLPTLERLSKSVETVVSWWQGLNPELKESVTNAIVLAAQFGMLAGFIGKLSGVGSVFLSLAASIAPILPVLLPILVIVGSLYLIAAQFREAWEENLWGVQDVFNEVWSAIPRAYERAMRYLFGGPVELTQLWTAALKLLMKPMELFTTAIMRASALQARALGRITQEQYDEQIKHIPAIAEAFAQAFHPNLAMLLPGESAILKGFGEDLSAGIRIGGKYLKRDGEALLDYIKRYAASLSTMLAPKLPGRTRKEQEEAKKKKDEEERKLSELQEKIRDARTEHEAEEAFRAWEEGQEQYKRLVESYNVQAQREREARDIVRGNIAGSIGNLGSVIGKVQTVLAGNMNPLGTALGIAAELIITSTQYGSLIDQLNAVVQKVVDGLGILITGAMPLVAVAGQIVDALIGGLRPVFEILADVLTTLAPVLWVVAMLFQGIAPVFEIVARLLQLVMPILEGAMMAVYYALRGVALVVMAIVYALGKVWNTMLEIPAWLLSKISEIEIAGARPFEFMADWASTLREAQVDTLAMEQAMTKLANTTYESAAAEVEKTAAVNAAARQVDKFSESLTNVPEGLRVAAQRYHAQTPAGAGSPLLGSGALRLGTGQQQIVVQVQGNIIGIRDLAAAIKRINEATVFQRTGLALEA